MKQDIKEVYFAGGCFWGTQHFFKQITGVLTTTAGYANGHADDIPTYEMVSTETTGYAETVHVTYDAVRIDLPFLLELFFETIDPTSLNRQGCDVGTRYRTGVFVTSDEDMALVEKFIARKQETIEQKIVVEVQRLANFHDAEDYHQDYLDKHPRGYCHIPFKLFKLAKESRMGRKPMSAENAPSTDEHELKLNRPDDRPEVYHE